MKPIYRISRPGDEQELKEIWKTVFGDSDMYIDNFFEKMYSSGSAHLCEVDGKIVSAAYLLDLGEFVCPGNPAMPATVLYALATLPEWRGRGIGGNICKMVLFHSEHTARTVCPAERSLFDYYSGRFGYKPFFSVTEKNISSSKKPIEYRSVTAHEYGCLRESILDGRAHILYNEKTLAYQRSLCTGSGGDMISFLGGCAAFEVYNNAVVFKEFLCSRDAVGTASAVLSVLGYESAVLRSPCVGDTKNSRELAMIMPNVSCQVRSPSPWYGFAFD